MAPGSTGTVARDDRTPGGRPGRRALQHEVEALEQENEALRHQVGGTRRSPRSAGAGPSPRGCSSSWPASWPCCRWSSSTPATNCSTPTRSWPRWRRWPRTRPSRPRSPPRSATTWSPGPTSSSGCKNALPDRAGFLADPITGAVQTATYQITLKLVQSPQFQTLWEQALRRSHEQLDNLLLGQKVGALQATNGEVTVDLSQVEDAAKQAAGRARPVGVQQAPELHRCALRALPVRPAGQAAAVGPVPQPPGAGAADRLDRSCSPAPSCWPVTDDGAWSTPRPGLAVSMALLLVAANVGRNQYLSSLQCPPVEGGHRRGHRHRRRRAARHRADRADRRRHRGHRGLRRRARARASVDARAHYAGVADRRPGPRHGRRPPQGLPVGRPRPRPGGPRPVEPADRQGGADHRPGHPVRGRCWSASTAADVGRREASTAEVGAGPARTPALPTGSDASRAA